MAIILPILQTNDKRNVEITLIDLFKTDKAQDDVILNLSDDYAYFCELFSPNFTMTVRLKYLNTILEAKSKIKPDIVTFIGEYSGNLQKTHQILTKARSIALLETIRRRHR